MIRSQNQVTWSYALRWHSKGKGYSLRDLIAKNLKLVEEDVRVSDINLVKLGGEKSI